MSNTRQYQIIANEITAIPNTIGNYFSIPECERCVVHVFCEISSDADFIDIGWFIRESPDATGTTAKFTRTPLRAQHLLKLTGTSKTGTLTYVIDNPSQYLQLVFSRLATNPGKQIKVTIALEFLD